MAFSEDQVKKLEAPLAERNVKHRQKGNVSLSYLEGWKAIEVANDIFGHDGWTRETVSMDCVFSGEAKGKPFVAYVARVRIVVTSPDGIISIREGTGYGNGYGKDPGEAYEGATKEAETDAMKRALMTYGWPFGLALYDKSQEHVADEPPKPPKKMSPGEMQATIAKLLDAFEPLFVSPEVLAEAIGHPVADITEDEIPRLRSAFQELNRTCRTRPIEEVPKTLRSLLGDD